MLTASGVTLCAVGSVLVYFEYRHELTFFWLGGLAFVVGSVLETMHVTMFTRFMSSQ